MAAAAAVAAVSAPTIPAISLQQSGQLRAAPGRGGRCPQQRHGRRYPVLRPQAADGAAFCLNRISGQGAA